MVLLYVYFLSGNFGSAGGLGAVADHAGDHRQGVDNGVGHGLIVAAQEVGNARACPAAGTDVYKRQGGDRAAAAALAAEKLLRSRLPAAAGAAPLGP